MVTEQMEMETIKQAVRECLIKVQNCTPEYADKLMAQYDDDFPELMGWKLDPQTASGFIISGLY